MNDRVLYLDPYKVLHLRRQGHVKAVITNYDNDPTQYLYYPDGRYETLTTDIYGDPEAEQKQADAIEHWLELLMPEQRTWLLDDAQKLSHDDLTLAYKLVES